MSLINDALRDLEARDSTSKQKQNLCGSADSKTLHFSSEEWGKEKRGKFFSNYFAMISSVGIMSIAVAAYLFSGSASFSQKGSVEVDRKVLVSPFEEKHTKDYVGQLGVTSFEKELLQSKTVSAEVSQTEISGGGSASIINSDSEDKLVSELSKAKLALASLRLTKPVNDNAVYYYQQVLSVEPGNAIALQGMNAVKEKYTYLYERALAENDAVRAQRLLISLNALLEETEKQSYQNLIASIERKYSQESKQSELKNIVVNKVSEEESSKGSSLQVQASKAQLEDDILARFDTLRREGNTKGAEQWLTQNLRVNPKLDSVTNTLLDIYLSQSRYREAMEIVLEIDTYREDHAHIYAESLRALQGEGAALAFLDSLTNLNLRAQAAYAGLLQKHERYPDAVRAYSRLLAVDQNNGLYWLGIAVSLDKAGESSRALSAYRSAAKFNRKNPDLMRFVENRIKSLSRQKNKLELSQW